MFSQLAVNPVVIEVSLRTRGTTASCDRMPFHVAWAHIITQQSKTFLSSSALLRETSKSAGVPVFPAKAHWLKKSSCTGAVRAVTQVIQVISQGEWAEAIPRRTFWGLEVFSSGFTEDTGRSCRTLTKNHPRTINVFIENFVWKMCVVKEGWWELNNGIFIVGYAERYGNGLRNVSNKWKVSDTGRPECVEGYLKLLARVIFCGEV